MPAGTGRRTNSRTGRLLPGYYVYWHTYDHAGRRTLHSKRFEAQRAARTWMKRHNARADLEALDETIPITITDAGQAFLATLTTRAPGTTRQYTATIKRLALLLGDPLTCDVTGADLDRLMGELTAAGTEANAAKHVRNLKRFFNWCIANGYARTNPTSAISSPPRQRIARIKPRITDAQFVALIAAIDSDTRRLGVQIAATTGLDRGVIGSLTHANVDIERCQFHVIRFKSRRVVFPYIHDRLIPQIVALLALVPPGRPLLPDFLIQSRPGDWWSKAVVAAGCPALRFRDLRTYAVNLLRDVLGDFETQAVVGHSTPAVTQRHYYQSHPDAQRRISALPLPGTAAGPHTANTPPPDRSAAHSR
jgi:integrase